MMPARRWQSIGLSIWLCLLLSGCFAAAVGGGAAAASAAHDRRSFGKVLDDQGIELAARNYLYQHEDIDRQDRIKIVSYNGKVLLAGEIETEQKKQLASEIVADINGVDQVVNELRVSPRLGIGHRVSDSYLTARVNTALLTENPVPGFDPSRVKVVSVDDTVYLMGLLSPAEGDAVTEVVRRVRGVRKVVKVFEYRSTAAGLSDPA